MKNILKMATAEKERAMIIAYLEDNNFNQTLTAQVLGVHRNTLINKMQKYKIKSK